MLAPEVISQFVRTAHRYLEALYNGLPFTLTHFFKNILEFVRQTSIIATVCLRFYRQSDVTLLKEFQQCLNWRYLASTSFIYFRIYSIYFEITQPSRGYTNRYTQREFQLKFSALLKACDAKIH